MDFLPSQNSNLPQRIADFSTITEALDYAAKGETGVCFYNRQGGITQILTYRNMRKKAVATGAKLSAIGLGRNDAVAIVAETSTEYLCLFYACQYAGLLACPLPFAIYPGGKSSYIDQLTTFVRAGNAKLLCLPDVLVDLTAELTQRTGILVFSFSQLNGIESAMPIKPLQSDEAAYIQFSSGSTAEPKGIVISQSAVTSNVRGILRQCIEIGPSDRAFSWLPFYHDMGLVGFSIAPLLSQTTADYLSPADFARRPLVWLQLMSQNRSTITYAPVFGYKLAAQRLKSADNDFDLSSLRLAGVGGDMIDIKQLRHFATTTAPFGFDESAFTPSYGLAESTLLVTYRRGLAIETLDRGKLEQGVASVCNTDDTTTQAFAVCGKPLIGHELKVCGPDGTPLPDRRIGHIFIRGPSLMSAYRNSLPPDSAGDTGYIDTGDAGYIREGELIVTGRHKDMIAINGRNIWPQDIEQTVMTLPELSSARVAAFAIHDDSSEAVIVLIECSSANRANVDDLKARLSAVLSATNGISAHIGLVRPGSLPLTSSGKLSRSGARRAYMNGGFVGEM